MLEPAHSILETRRQNHARSAEEKPVVGSQISGCRIWRMLSTWNTKAVSVMDQENPNPSAVEWRSSPQKMQKLPVTRFSSHPIGSWWQRVPPIVTPHSSEGFLELVLQMQSTKDEPAQLRHALVRELISPLFFVSIPGQGQCRSIKMCKASRNLDLARV